VWISCLLKLSNAQTGAVVLCSAFGSSAFLGYSFIMSVFPGQSVALDEGVLISEVGVGYPIYILAPMLASRFGTAGSKENGIYRKIVLDFLKSPVFFSLILGILWSVFKLPTGDHGFLGPFFKLFKDLSSALTPLAILSIGLMFEVPKIKSILIPFIIVVLIKLIFQPVAANVLSVSFGFSDLWREILVILSAMPPAVLGVVFLKRYGADASLASALVIAVTLVSVITLTGMALLIH
jgi:predicted permease